MGDGRIRKLTGGVPVKGKLLYENQCRFTPTHHFGVACNEIWDMRMKKAVYGRIRAVPCDQKFVPEHKLSENPGALLIDETLEPYILANELPGVLNWFVEGCRKWQECVKKNKRLIEPGLVRQQVADLMDDADLLADFCHDWLVKDHSGVVSRKDMFDAFCAHSGKHVRLSSKAFLKYLREKAAAMGLIEHSDRTWRGYRLKQCAIDAISKGDDMFQGLAEEPDEANATP